MRMVYFPEVKLEKIRSYLYLHAGMLLKNVYFIVLRTQHEILTGVR